MKITTRLVLSFLAVTILPLAAMSLVGLRAGNHVSSLAVTQSTEALRQVGEEAIREKALDVAAQVALYLESQLESASARPENLMSDQDLAAIAVQPVGETGYTAVYDQEGIVYFHADPALVGTNMRSLARALPAFWSIYERSLQGAESDGYYRWKDADGTMRDKYMSCVPVEDTPLRVAATTYIDEFYRPILETSEQIDRTFRETYVVLSSALVALAAVAVGVALWLAWGISRPVHRLIQAAVALERGIYEPGLLSQDISRQDDMGRLARVFDRVAQELQAREISLQRQINELKIQIDHAKRARDVARITETDDFKRLQEQARRMRHQEEGEEEQEGEV